MDPEAVYFGSHLVYDLRALSVTPHRPVSVRVRVRVPSSSIIYVNTKAFNIETCNATNNIKNFMMQVPGRIMSMVPYQPLLQAGETRAIEAGF